MTDARLRGNWLGKIRYDDLSDPAWRVFTGALMWSAEQGTDGAIPRRYVKTLHPDGELPAAVDELIKGGIMTRTRDGSLQLIGWDTELGQSPAEKVEEYREKSRARQRRYRERQAQRKKTPPEGSDTDHDSQPRTGDPDTGDATRDVTRDVGRGRGRGRGKDLGPADEAKITDWKVRKPGTQQWIETADGDFVEIA